jgi:hypothetical protein
MHRTPPSCVSEHADVLWMLWLVPAAVAAALAGWVDSRPKPRRASWEMDLDGRGWSRVINSGIVFFTSMAGVASTDSSMSFGARLGVIVVAIGVPLSVASLVSRRKGKAPSTVASEG